MRVTMGSQYPTVDEQPLFVEREGASRLRSSGRSADFIRAFPWGCTPLGPLEGWDDQFIATLNLVLETRFPMFVTWGPDNHLLHNDAFETVLVGKGDAIGRPLQAVFPESWPVVGPVIEDALEGRSSYFEDLPMALARNNILEPTWWSFSYSPARQTDGSIGGVLGVVYETTRRINAEEALRTSEAALLAVTDMAPSLLWNCDLEGRLTWVNQGLQSYFGLRSLAGISWDDHVHPEDVETAHQVHAMCVRTGRQFECQQRLRGADGRSRWFMVRCRQVRNEAGVVTGWCGSASDIDDWRGAADGLKERDELLKHFHEGEATLMWVGTVATREVEALNAGSRSVWALPEDGRPIVWEEWLNFAHPDDRPQLSNLFDRAAAGEVAQARFRRASANGAVRRFHVTGFSIPSGDDGSKRIGGLIVEVASDTEARIYLIDNDAPSQNTLSHGLSRQGFKVRTFDDDTEFQKISGDLQPGCVVVAVDGDFDQTLKTAAALRATRNLPWIAIGDFGNRLQDVVQLMKLGAADVLTSPDLEAVATASRAALAVAYGKAAGSRAPADARQKLTQLSPRERQVLDGLVAGGTNKSIAKALDLSPRTVETHRAHLMDRLGVSTLAELVKLAADGQG